MSCIEQVLETTPHKTPAVRPPTHVRRTRHAGHCWRSKDKLISDILLWTPSLGRAKVGRSARTYIQQRCADTGYSRPGAIDDRDGWRERVREIHAGSVVWWFVFNTNNFLIDVWPMDGTLTGISTLVFWRCLWCNGIIYQPLRSGRIWHKVNF